MGNRFIDQRFPFFCVMKFNNEVSKALENGSPVVALESTVTAHGLPFPQNLENAEKLEKIVRDNGAIPATIAVFGGEFCVGLEADEIERLAKSDGFRKISRRDLPVAVAKKLDCATTVATTSFIAHRAGIKVFATGGIGGVHRGFSFDISADLPELARTPITVVCSGAKSVLDLPATREWLETHGVTILGWKCDEFPAFYSTKSGLAVDERIDSAADAAEIIAARDALGLSNAILITVPVPEKFAIDASKIEAILERSLAAAEEKNVSGKEITPFLLSEMSRLSNGETLAANIALLENNARVAAQLAKAMG